MRRGWIIVGQELGFYLKLIAQILRNYPPLCWWGGILEIFSCKFLGRVVQQLFLMFMGELAGVELEVMAALLE